MKYPTGQRSSLKARWPVSQYRLFVLECQAAVARPTIPKMPRPSGTVGKDLSPSRGDSGTA